MFNTGLEMFLTLMNVVFLYSASVCRPKIQNMFKFRFLKNTQGYIE